MDFRINFVQYLPDISAHSGDVKLYLPSIIFRNITICLRCQNGGQPTSNVNIITPQAHLIKKIYNKIFVNYSTSRKAAKTYTSTSFEQPADFSNILHLSVSGAKYPGVPHRSKRKNIYIRKSSKVSGKCIHVHRDTFRIIILAWRIA